MAPHDLRWSYRWKFLKLNCSFRSLYEDAAISYIPVIIQNKTNLSLKKTINFPSVIPTKKNVSPTMSIRQIPNNEWKKVNKQVKKNAENHSEDIQSFENCSFNYSKQDDNVKPHRGGRGRGAYKFIPPWFPPSTSTALRIDPSTDHSNDILTKVEPRLASKKCPLFRKDVDQSKFHFFPVEDADEESSDLSMDESSPPLPNYMVIQSLGQTEKNFGKRKNWTRNTSVELDGAVSGNKLLQGPMPSCGSTVSNKEKNLFISTGGCDHRNISVDFCRNDSLNEIGQHTFDVKNGNKFLMHMRNGLDNKEEESDQESPNQECIPQFTLHKDALQILSFTRENSNFTLLSSDSSPDQEFRKLNSPKKTSTDHDYIVDRPSNVLSVIDNDVELPDLMHPIDLASQTSRTKLEVTLADVVANAAQKDQDDDELSDVSTVVFVAEFGKMSIRKNSGEDCVIENERVESESEYGKKNILKGAIHAYEIVDLTAEDEEVKQTLSSGSHFNCEIPEVNCYFSSYSSDEMKDICEPMEVIQEIKKSGVLIDDRTEIKIVDSIGHHFKLHDEMPAIKVDDEENQFRLVGTVNLVYSELIDLLTILGIDNKVSHNDVMIVFDSVNENNIVNHISSVPQCSESSLNEMHFEDIIQPIQSETHKLQHIAETTLQRIAETHLQQIAETTKQQIAETNMQHIAETTMQQIAGTTLQHIAETTVQKIAETTMEKIAETTMQQIAETTTQKIAETIIQQTAETSKQQSVNETPLQQIAESSIQQIAVIPLQQADERFMQQTLQTDEISLQQHETADIPLKQILVRQIAEIHLEQTAEGVLKHTDESIMQENDEMILQQSTEISSQQIEIIMQQSADMPSQQPNEMPLLRISESIMEKNVEIHLKQSGECIMQKNDQIPLQKTAELIILQIPLFPLRNTTEISRPGLTKVSEHFPLMIDSTDDVYSSSDISLENKNSFSSKLDAETLVLDAIKSSNIHSSTDINSVDFEQITMNRNQTDCSSYKQKTHNIFSIKLPTFHHRIKLTEHSDKASVTGTSLHKDNGDHTLDRMVTSNASTKNIFPNILNEKIVNVLEDENLTRIETKGEYLTTSMMAFQSGSIMEVSLSEADHVKSLLSEVIDHELTGVETEQIDSNGNIAKDLIYEMKLLKTDGLMDQIVADIKNSDSSVITDQNCAHYSSVLNKKVDDPYCFADGRGITSGTKTKPKMINLCRVADVYMSVENPTEVGIAEMMTVVQENNQNIKNCDIFINEAQSSQASIDHKSHICFESQRSEHQQDEHYDQHCSTEDSMCTSIQKIEPKFSMFNFLGSALKWNKGTIVKNNDTLLSRSSNQDNVKAMEASVLKQIVSKSVADTAIISVQTGTVVKSDKLTENCAVSSPFFSCSFSSSEIFWEQKSMFSNQINSCEFSNKNESSSFKLPEEITKFEQEFTAFTTAEDRSSEFVKNCVWELPSSFSKSEFIENTENDADLHPSLNSDDIIPKFVKSDELILAIMQSDVEALIINESDKTLPAVTRPDEYMFPEITNYDAKFMEIAKSDATLQAIPKSGSITPGITKSDATSPAINQSGSLIPEITKPDATLPEISMSGSIFTGITKSDATLQAITKSVATSPAIIKSKSIISEITKSDATLPAITKSGLIFPEIHESDATSPSIIQSRSILPGITKSDATSPAIIKSGSIIPEITNSDETLPVITMSDAALSAITNSEETLPEITKSYSTLPEITKSDATIPTITKSDPTLLAITKSGSILPVMTVSYASLPAISKSEVALPAITNAEETPPKFIQSYPILRAVNNSDATFLAIAKPDATLMVVFNSDTTHLSIMKSEETFSRDLKSDATLLAVTKSDETLPVIAKHEVLFPEPTNNSALPAILKYSYGLHELIKCDIEPPAYSKFEDKLSSHTKCDHNSVVFTSHDTQMQNVKTAAITNSGKVDEIISLYGPQADYIDSSVDNKNMRDVSKFSEKKNDIPSETKQSLKHQSVNSLMNRISNKLSEMKPDRNLQRLEDTSSKPDRKKCQALQMPNFSFPLEKFTAQQQILPQPHPFSIIPNTCKDEMDSQVKNMMRVEEQDSTSKLIEAKLTSSPKKRKQRQPTYRHIQVYLNDTYEKNIRAIWRAGDILLATLRRNCDQVSSISSFKALRPQLTCFLLNQLVKKIQRSKAYSLLLILHGMVKTADMLIAFGLRSAVSCLEVFRDTHHDFVKGYYDALIDQLITNSDKPDRVHAKVITIKKEMERIGDTECKLLVVGKREPKAICVQLCEVFAESSVILVLQMCDIQYQKLVHILETHSVVVWGGHELPHNFPWCQFSLVVDWEGKNASTSPIVSYCQRQNIRVITFEVQLPSVHPQQDAPEKRIKLDESVQVDKMHNNENTLQSESNKEDARDTITVVVSEKVTGCAELHFQLTSKFSISVVERKLRDVCQSDNFERGWADVVVDECTCILLQIVGQLRGVRGEEILQHLTHQLLLMSLQCSTCYVILVVNASDEYLFRGNTVRLLSHLLATCVLFRNQEYSVSLLLAQSWPQVAECIRNVCESTRDASQLWDFEAWTLRKWMNVEMSTHEKFLLRIPCINPLAAQLMLTMTSLSELVTLPLSQLIDILPWIPRKVLQMLHKVLNHNHLGHYQSCQLLPIQEYNEEHGNESLLSSDNHKAVPQWQKIVRNVFSEPHQISFSDKNLRNFSDKEVTNHVNFNDTQDIEAQQVDFYEMEDTSLVQVGNKKQRESVVADSSKYLSQTGSNRKLQGFLPQPVNYGLTVDTPFQPSTNHAKTSQTWIQAHSSHQSSQDQSQITNRILNQPKISHTNVNIRPVAGPRTNALSMPNADGNSNFQCNRPYVMGIAKPHIRQTVKTSTFNTPTSHPSSKVTFNRSVHVLPQDGVLVEEILQSQSISGSQTLQGRGGVGSQQGGVGGRGVTIDNREFGIQIGNGSNSWG